MEALSAPPVSSLRASPLPPANPRDAHLLFRSSSASQAHSHVSERRPPYPSSCSLPATKLSSASSFCTKSSNRSPLRLPFPPPTPHVNSSASSGYAAALLDAAQSQGSLDRVSRDVRRLSRMLRSQPLCGFLTDPEVDRKAKGDVLREAAARGGLHHLVAALVKVVVGAGREEVLGQVLEEFRRVYDEMCGTSVVMVSSTKKMEEAELAGIAERVRRRSGSYTVRVRHVVDGGLPKMVMQC